jgi:hypothetical protein
VQVSAPGTLILPRLQGASWKIHGEEPEQGYDEVPQDDHQVLPDLRRQNLPPCPHDRCCAGYRKRILYQASAVKGSSWSHGTGVDPSCRPIVLSTLTTCIAPGQ